MPVADKPEVTAKTIQAVLGQDYPNLELIVVDDGQDKQAEMIAKLQKISALPLRYITLGGEGYNLAKARNIASIEATGELLVFCDQRMQMDKDCISQFVAKHKPKLWLYGNKGAKKDFVENLSCISKEDFVTFGMFNERCDKYGALSQETRNRFRRQGGNTLYIEEAKATPLGVSRNKSKKRFEIMESKNWLWKVGLQ
jgi:glycosyltransferase involved in cell wall biosynthesis